MQSQASLGLSTDLLTDIAKANPKRVGRWSAELERTGQVVLRTSFFKTLGAAVAAWIFVATLIAMFTIMPLSMWNPLSDDFAGWVQLFFVLLLFAGLILFAFGAVLWTFVFPLVRPRMVVSQWGIQTVVSKPGGQFVLFTAAWSDVERVGGIYTVTRWPFPPMLSVTITARGQSVERNTLIRPRRMTETVTSTVSRLLTGRPRDVLALLVQAHGAFGEKRAEGL